MAAILIQRVYLHHKNVIPLVQLPITAVHKASPKCKINICRLVEDNLQLTLVSQAYGESRKYLIAHYTTYLQKATSQKSMTGVFVSKARVYLNSLGLYGRRPKDVRLYICIEST